MEKNSFVMYSSYLDQVNLLSNEDAGKLFKMILSYAQGDEVAPDNGMVNMAFSFIRAQIDKDKSKYKEICQKRAEAGALGGRPKKANALEENPKKQMVSSESKQKQKNPDNEYEYDNDNDLNKKNNTKKSNPKTKHGEYQNVALTDEENQKLIQEYGQIVRDKAVDFLDAYIEEKHYKSKSHYLAIRRWVIDAVNKPTGKPDKPKQNFDGRSYDFAALESEVLHG